MAGRSLPEMIRLTARVPRGEAGYWQIMLRLDRAQGDFTVADVEGESNLQPSGAVAQYLRKLVKAGFARHVADRPAPARPQKVYQLVKTPKEAPRLRRDGSTIDRSDRDCLWTAMRSLKQFNYRELAFAATTGRIIQLATADRYVAHLAAAGYLAALGNGVYRLKPKMDTGPLAPSILRVQAVFDRNLRKLVGDEHDASEVAP